MIDFMLAKTAAVSINHLLRGADWARERLKPFAGKAVRFAVLPFDLALTIEETGDVREAELKGERADVTFRFSALLLPRLFLNDEAAYREVETTGDEKLASEVAYLFRNLRWDAEEDLSRFFGDVIAHRLAQMGSACARWPGEVAQSIARNAVEYFQEENRLLANPEHVQRFLHQVDVLRDNVERLEKRVEKLSRSLKKG